MARMRVLRTVMLLLIWVTKCSCDCDGSILQPNVAADRCILWQCVNLYGFHVDQLKNYLPFSELERRHNRIQSDDYVDEYGNEYLQSHRFGLPVPVTDPPSFRVADIRCSEIHIKTSTILTLTQNFLLNLNDVRKLIISDVKLEACASDAFADQKDLDELRITGNPLRNITFGMFNYLIKLQILDLSKNEITIIDDHAFWGALGLKELYLNDNNISVLSDLVFKPLLKLRTLNLSNNPLKIVANISLPVSRFFSDGISTRTIAVEDGKILLGTQEDLFISLNASRVIEIHLSDNGISSLENTLGATTTELERLDLGFNNLSLLGNFVSNVSRLRFLDLSANQLVEVDVSSFIGLGNLATLNLRDNILSYLPPGLFKDLVNLESLDLSHNHIEQIGFGFFDSMEKLRVLNVSGNYITKISLHSFHNREVQLDELYLDNNRLENVDLQQIFRREHKKAKLSLNKNNWECYSRYSMLNSINMQTVEIVDKRLSNALSFRGIECHEGKTDAPDIHPSANFSSLDGSKFLKFFESDFQKSAFFKYFDRFNAAIFDRIENSNKFSGLVADQSNRDVNENLDSKELASVLKEISQDKDETDTKVTMSRMLYFQVVTSVGTLTICIFLVSISVFAYKYFIFTKSRRLSLGISVDDNNL